MGWFNPNPIPKGDKAPPFTVESTSGKFSLEERLKDGPILLMFYMGDFGTTCTWALNKLAEITPQIKEAGAAVAAVSVNPMTMHQRFLARMDFPFPLLSDESREVTTAYGSLITGHPLYKGMSGRAVYLIGTDGSILYSWMPEDDPALSPDFPALVETVRELLS